jgi:Ca2+-binding RTX toxin-like protein
VIGGTGNDVIEGDSSDNILDGGTGLHDTLSFASVTSAVQVNIGAVGKDLNGDSTIDIVANRATGSAVGTDTVTNFDDVTGGSGDDTIVGSATANTIYAGLGDDTLFGEAGADELYGEEGDDVLIGGTGQNTLNGGANTTKGDTASYAGTDAIVATLRGAEYTGNSYGTVVHNGETDKLFLIENIIGSSVNDTIEGNSVSNTLDGGDGVDTVSFANASSAVSVDLAINTTTQATGADGSDFIKNFENLTGSSHNDILKGDSIGKHYFRWCWR